MSINTKDKAALDAYTFFVSEIQPKMAPYSDAFNNKLVNSSFKSEVGKEGFDIYLRSVQKSLELYREENVPIFAEISNESRKFGEISGAQVITKDGEELTMQQAAQFLKSSDRQERQSVYEAMNSRRLKDVDQLNKLFNQLVDLRHQVALNVGFENYRDYKFEELGRFDYTVNDCEQFHHSISQEVVPLLKTVHLRRKADLGLKELKPWDTEVDVEGLAPLKPFANGEEMINKTIDLFDVIRPQYGEYLKIMKAMGHLDLESKQGKMPGGYNYPLYEIGVPFIFMNSVGSQRDLVTMVHEGGHAIHSFLSRDLELTGFKSLPSEVAELASMSMELISMEHWDVIYPNIDDLKRAKKDQLEKLLMILPWIATVDSFQNKLYQQPSMTDQERELLWLECLSNFSTGVIDHSDSPDALKNSWQRQLHIFEVPFYYIEYAIAQLGAIAVWKNYKKDPEKALNQYESALKLGYTRSIPEIYEAAGIKFNFSRVYVKELMDFVLEELKKIDSTAG